jgi:hypothetical protein
MRKTNARTAAQTKHELSMHPQRSRVALQTHHCLRDGLRSHPFRKAREARAHIHWSLTSGAIYSECPRFIDDHLDLPAERANPNTL